MTAVPAGRILGTPVSMLVPADGPVQVLIMGEAPGPRGADKSGVPFLGDAAGRMLYDVLARMGAVTLPAAVTTLPWDGAVFAAQGIVPLVHGVALGNAFNRCPTDNGATFRAPTRSELDGPENAARLTRDLAALRARGLIGVVTLGRVATRTLDALCAQLPMPELARCAVPHPSAQGLLSMAPGRGKGARMADLQEAWMVRCEDAIRRAGYAASARVTS